MNQHDHEYLTIQNVIAHAGKLWQTLDRDKVRQELKENRKKAQRQRENFGQRRHDCDDSQPQDQSKEQNSHQSSQQGSQQESCDSHDFRQFSRQDCSRSKNHLFTKEHEYHRENHLCFRCDYSDHSAKNCKHSFNLNQTSVKEEDKIKSQSSKT